MSDIEKKQEELNRLHRLLCEKDQEFEKAKGKRTVVTILIFTAFYYWILWLLAKPSGAEFLTNLFVAAVFASIHFFANLTIFSQLCQKGREESEILDSIRNRIKETEKSLR